MNFARHLPALLFGLATLAAPCSARAAGTADEAPHLKRLQPQATPAADDFVLPPLPEPGPAARDTRPITVERIVFRGNRAIASVELERLAAPYVGKPITVGDLEELRQKISRHYVAQGYINSGALLPEAAYVDGTLSYEIVEGRLAAIRIRGQEGLQAGYLTERLADAPDAPLNIDRLRERFALLLNDPLFERMNARLAPGARAGEALLDIDVVRARPYQFAVAVNNYRPPSIGEESLELTGWLRNLTGNGDVLEFLRQNSTAGQAGGRTNLSWQIPVGAPGTLLSFRSEEGQSAVIEEPMRRLDIESRIDSKTLGLGHVFHESLRHKLSLGIDYQERENRTRLLGAPFSFVPGEPDGVSRIEAWRFWQEYTYRTETRVVALRSTFVAARNNLEDLTGLPAQAVVQPAHRYGYWLGQAQYVHLLGQEGARLILRGTLQQSTRRLLPMDGLAIGGVNTVRGFRENQLVRDRGAVFNLELEYPLHKAAGLDLTLNPFYDIGRGRNQDEPTDTLAALGLAAHLRWQGLSLDLAVAKRLKNTRPGADTGTLQDKGIHFQLGYSFF